MFAMRTFTFEHNDVLHTIKSRDMRDGSREMQHWIAGRKVGVYGITAAWASLSEDVRTRTIRHLTSKIASATSGDDARETDLSAEWCSGLCSALMLLEGLGTE